MIMTYSYKKDGETKVSPHFKVKEFHSKNDPSDVVIIDSRLVELLENIRTFTGKPVIINSGFRSPAYNASIRNASPKSQHTLGKAADIVIRGIEPKHIAKITESYIGSSGGIGVYKHFTHVDVRTSCSRWNGAY